MQYQFTERLEYIKTIEFLSPGISNTAEPLHIEKITYFQEEGVTGVLTNREFSYSWDKIIWSNWNTLSLANLTGISFRDKPDFYLKVRYTRTGIGSGNILRWYLIYSELAPTPPSPPSPEGCDCSTFGGEGPEYFLDRANHIGPYTDITFSNVEDGSSAGVWHETLNSSIGTNVYFKRIKAGEGVTVEENSLGIIEIGVDASISGGDTYQSALDPSVKMLDPLGGIPAGTSVSDLNGDSLSSLWDALLFPTIQPILNAPSYSFTDNVGSYQEVGTIINGTFSSSFNRGSIFNGSTFQNYRAGLPSGYDYTDASGNTLLVDISTASLSNNQTITGYLVKIGTQSFSGRIFYTVGPQPLDNKGAPAIAGPLPPGSIGPITTSFEGVYPLYGTTSLISNPNTPQALVSMLSGNNIEITLIVETGGFKQSFDIPIAWTSSPTNRPLLDVEQFSPDFNTWNSIGLGQWTTSSIFHGGIQYTRYTYNGPVIGGRKIRLKF